MAVHRYGQFTPARRAALRKAQLASAAKRRGIHKPSAATQRRIKRVAIGAGVLGASAAVAYGGHKAAGGHYAKSTFKNIPTVPHRSGVRRNSFTALQHTVSVTTNRPKKGTHTIRQYSTVRNKPNGGKKVMPAYKMKPYKLSAMDRRRVRKFNKPAYGSAQHAREALRHPHSHIGKQYTTRKLEAGEAIRRTSNYVQYAQSKGRSVSVSHRTTVMAQYAKQPRYPFSGNVKPIKRRASVGARRRQNRFYTRKNMSYSSGPTVLGSRKRTK